MKTTAERWVRTRTENFMELCAGLDVYAVGSIFCFACSIAFVDNCAASVGFFTAGTVLAANEVVPRTGEMVFRQITRTNLQ